MDERKEMNSELIKKLSQMMEQAKKSENTIEQICEEYNTIADKHDMESRIRKNELLTQSIIYGWQYMTSDLLDSMNSVLNSLDTVSQSTKKLADITDKLSKEDKKTISIVNSEISKIHEKVEKTLSPLNEVVKGEQEIRNRENNDIYN